MGRKHEGSFLKHILLWLSLIHIFGIIGPLLHSLSWFVALMSLIVLLSVLSIRRKCCRPSSLWKLHLTPSWLFAIVSVLVCSAGLGLLIYHMDPSDPVLWTSSDYAADAARLFRTFAAEALLLICIAGGYMRTAPIRKRWNAWLLYTASGESGVLDFMPSTAISLQ